jgi:hypothetical protein
VFGNADVSVKAELQASRTDDPWTFDSGWGLRFGFGGPTLLIRESGEWLTGGDWLSGDPAQVPKVRGKSSAIKTNVGDINVLRIRREGSHAYYYVNSILVGTQAGVSSDHGIELFATTSVVFRDLVVNRM